MILIPLRGGCILPEARHKLRLGPRSLVEPHWDRIGSVNSEEVMTIYRITKPISLVVPLLTGACIYLALVLPAFAQSLEKTRLGISDLSFTFLPHILARDGGFFRKHGMDVELIYVGGRVSIYAMAGGGVGSTPRRAPRTP